MTLPVRAPRPAAAVEGRDQPVAAPATAPWSRGSGTTSLARPGGALAGSEPGARLSIGEVLARLLPEFADVTLSKIRFLEAEGLVSPERSPSGYRKFSHADLARLRYVLAAQRDQYLPLRVIKDNLAALDRGLQPAAGDGEPQLPRATAVAADGVPGPDAFVPPATELRLSRAELLRVSGLQDEQLAEVERYGLLTAEPAGHYGGTALLVAKAVAGLARFGLEARHLRAFKTAADREVGLVQQVVNPIARQRDTGARARAEEATRELAALSVSLHTALVKAGLRG